MSNLKVVFFSIAFVVLYSFSMGQGKPINLPGVGGALHFGLNPKSDYISWSIENVDYLTFPQNRFSIGPTLQFRNYKQLQIEASLQYSNTIYKNSNHSNAMVTDLRMNEFKFPVGVNLNGKSPFKGGNSMVYLAGVSTNLQIIPSQASVNEVQRNLNSSLFVGFRLSSSFRNSGRFEYGLVYNRNIIDNFVFSVSDGDSNPAVVSLNQSIGQVNVNLVYYLTPRTKRWTSDRYGMDIIAQ